jgi:hypothetical protein
MILVSENGLPYYRFESLAPWPELAHGVFTRSGGVSPQGLNLAFGPHDLEENVRENLDRVAEAMGFTRLAFVGQAHGDRSLVVRADSGYSPRRPADMIRGFDALIAPDPGVGLLVKLGDCQGVILYDPITRALALVHCGWRGNVANVLARTVERLAADFGVRPADLVAAIGPSLGPCCAEFVNFSQELPPSFLAYRVGKNHFDLWAVSRDQLVQAGLRPENIETAGLCTVCHEAFYSYRRDKTEDRFGLVAGRLDRGAR